VAGLRPNPLGELTTFPRPQAGFRGEGRDGREGLGGRGGKRGKDGKGRGAMGKGGIGPPTFWLLQPPKA